MARRHFHLSNGAVFVLLLCAGMVLLLLPSSITQRINFLFAETFEPLIRIGQPPPKAPEATGEIDGAYVSQEQYETLWVNYKNLHAQLIKLREDYETLAQIRSGLPRFYSALVVADIIRGGVGLSHEILINKGASDGLRQGCYVLSPERNSIIGVVRETSSLMARVRLLTDSNQSVEVRIRRDGAPLDVAALMFGNGRRGGVISMVEREKDIRPGDAVYAAPRPGLLDVPVIIGHVTDVQPDEESPLLWTIAVQPVEDTQNLKTVAVIVSDTIGDAKQSMK